MKRRNESDAHFHGKHTVAAIVDELGYGNAHIEYGLFPEDVTRYFRLDVGVPRLRLAIEVSGTPQYTSRRAWRIKELASHGWLEHDLLTADCTVPSAALIRHLSDVCLARQQENVEPYVVGTGRTEGRPGFNCSQCDLRGIWTRAAWERHEQMPHWRCPICHITRVSSLNGHMSRVHRTGPHPLTIRPLAEVMA